MGLLSEIMIEDDGHGTLVAENDRWRLWQNSSTQYYEKRLNEYDHNGFTMQGKLFVVYAESKTGESNSYLALEKGSQRPFMDWYSGEEFDIKLMLVLDDLKKDCNLINIAKSMKKRKKRKVKA